MWKVQQRSFLVRLTGLISRTSFSSVSFIISFFTFLFLGERNLFHFLYFQWLTSSRLPFSSLYLLLNVFTFFTLSILHFITYTSTLHFFFTSSLHFFFTFELLHIFTHSNRYSFTLSLYRLLFHHFSTHLIFHLLKKIILL